MDVTDVSPQGVSVEVGMKSKHEDPSKISAYYSLVFPNFTYYLQTLTVTIGRRCIPSVSSSSADAAAVDVDLGPLKSVSRLHAKIEYEEEEERFVLVVIGRNGAWVDGVWSGSGSRVPLGERSQVQIASRTFHFVLPPVVLPDESQSLSPSSQSSANRPRSPSVDITSISPPSPLTSHSPPPAAPPPALPKIPPLPDAQLPNSNAIGKPKTSTKKRKKPEVEPRPKPEVMPPKPQFTYAQLCYRAIKALGGKATLQDICQWMMETFDWYHFNEGAGWENSVRHNLSSGRAFKKMERCGGERGKGFFWSIDEKYEHTFEEQEAKSQAGAGGKGEGKQKKKEKGGASLLEPPLKRSVRDLKGGPLPPPLTSMPLVPKTSSGSVYSITPTLSYPPNHTPNQTSPSPASPVKSEPAPPSQLLPATPSQTPTPAWSNPPSAPVPPPLSAETSAAAQSTSAIHNLPDDVRLPITVGPVPESHPLAIIPPNDPLASFLKTPPIVLADNVLILNPDVFSHLTSQQLKELEALGTRKTLEILQSYIVRFIKEFKKGEGKGRGKPKKARGVAGVSTKKGKPTGVASAGPSSGRADVKAPHPTSGPFTTAPLPPRSIQPLQNPEGASRKTGQSVHAPIHGAVPAFVDVKPPVPVPIPSPSPAAPDPGPGDRAASPILIVDDSDPTADDDGPVAKRRRLEVPVAGAISG